MQLSRKPDTFICHETYIVATSFEVVVRVQGQSSYNTTVKGHAEGADSGYVAEHGFELSIFRLIAQSSIH